MPKFFKTFQGIQTGVDEKAFAKGEKTAVLLYHVTKRLPKHPWAWDMRTQHILYTSL